MAIGLLVVKVTYQLQLSTAQQQRSMPWHGHPANGLIDATGPITMWHGNAPTATV
jgi:hypothetical protein